MTATDLPYVGNVVTDDGNSHWQLERLIEKHADLVYAAAVRQVRDLHLAADVTQAVFLLLQRKLPGLGKETIMSAWLLRSTHYTCLAALHQERRRRHHEQKAAAMRAEEEAELVPDDLPERIDAALAKLGSADRAALASIYIEGLSHKELAGRLGVKEATVYKRVQRAVEKLRRLLREREREWTASAVGGVLLTIGKPAGAPTGVLAAVSAGVGGSPSAGVLTMMKGTLFMMKMIKVKVAAMVLAVAGVVALGTVELCQRAGRSEVQAAPTATLSAPPAATLGPIEERVIALRGDANRLLDLDTGQLMPRPVGWRQENIDIPTPLNGADLAGINSGPDSEQTALGAYGIDARSFADPETWNFTADQMLKILGPTFDPIDRRDFGRDPGTAATVRVIRTRDGAMGVMQVLGFTPDGSGVRVRYRLLINAAAPSKI